MDSGIETVVANLIDHFPVSIPLVRAGGFFNLKTAGAIYSSKHRGDFPVRITKIGGSSVVLTSDLIDFLRGQSQVNKGVK